MSVKFIPALLLIAGCATAAATPPSPRVTISPQFYSGAEYRRVGIYVEDNSGRFLQPGSYRQIEEEFMRSAIEKGYTVASRSDIERLQRELQFQASSATEADKITKIGRVLNVPVLLLVTVNKVETHEYQPTIRVGGQQYFATTVSISARLITVDQAQVLWISSYEGSTRVSNINGSTEAIAPIAHIVASGFPQRKP